MILAELDVSQQLGFAAAGLLRQLKPCQVILLLLLLLLLSLVEEPKDKLCCSM